MRQPKSTSEFERYTIANCAVEAKFMREKDQRKSEKEEEQGILKGKGVGNKIDNETQLESSIQNLKMENSDNVNTTRNDEISRGEDGNDDESVCSKGSNCSDESDESEEPNHAVNTNRFCFDDSSDDSSDDSIDN